MKPAQDDSLLLLLLLFIQVYVSKLKAGRKMENKKYSQKGGSGVPVLPTRDTTLQGPPTRCEPKRSGRASRLQPNRHAKLPVCAVQ